MRGGGGGGGKLLLESFLGKVPALSGIRSGAGMDIDCRFGRFRLSGLSNQSCQFEHCEQMVVPTCTRIP